MCWLLEVAETPEKAVNHAVPPSVPWPDYPVPLGEDASVPQLPVSKSLTVPGRPEQVAVARQFVASALGKDHPLADTAILLTSELVTNSLRHSASCRDGGTVTIAMVQVPGRVNGSAGVVWVEVVDDGAHGLPARRVPGQGDESGHGLQLVDALAARWGCRRDDAGATRTWFEITS